MTPRPPRLGQRAHVHVPGEDVGFATTVQDTNGLRLALLAAGDDAVRWLQPGTELTLTFHDGRAVYRWWCQVRRRVEGPVPLAWLDAPFYVEEIQRRQHVRLNASLPVTVRPLAHPEGGDATTAGEGGEEPPPLRGRTADVSAGGLAVWLPVALEPGRAVEVELMLPGRAVRTEARIVRCEPPGPAGVRHGLRFSRLRPVDEEAIYRWIFHEMRLLQQKGLLKPRGR